MAVRFLVLDDFTARKVERKPYESKDLDGGLRRCSGSGREESSNSASTRLREDLSGDLAAVDSNAAQLACPTSEPCATLIAGTIFATSLMKRVAMRRISNCSTSRKPAAPRDLRCSGS